MKVIWYTLCRVKKWLRGISRVIRVSMSGVFYRENGGYESVRLIRERERRNYWRGNILKPSSPWRSLLGTAPTSGDMRTKASSRRLLSSRKAELSIWWNRTSISRFPACRVSWRWLNRKISDFYRKRETRKGDLKDKQKSHPES